ncbi:MAG: trypsin-like peptidase domain-containing protein [Planctomycetes bacterium]|nr:trypsin-like peptidase domain-containing protein [Planctomycetota bacterium]
MNLILAEDLPHPLSLAEIRAAEKSVKDTIRKALPAVVFIEGGSGALISSAGLILTNDHVVGERKEFKVHFALTGRVGWASLLGRYPEGDIALLKLQKEEAYPFLELGDSEPVQPGEQVLAFGNPFLLGDDNVFFPNSPADFYPSVSLGVVSAVHRNSPPRYPDAIQVDVAVNPGNSGGPLLTLEGKIVGVNGKIETRFGLSVNSGVGYAVPSRQVQRFLGPLKEASGGIVYHGHLPGLEVAERAGAGSPGLLVARVVQDSPAAKAGFQAGNRIIAIDGRPIPTRHRFEGIFKSYPVESRMTFRVLRGEKEEEIAVTLHDAKIPAKPERKKPDEDE